MAESMSHNDQKHTEPDQPSLSTEAVTKAHCFSPRLLVVSDAEAASDTNEADPPRRFGWHGRVRINRIRECRHGEDDQPTDMGAPTYYNDADVEVMLETLAEKDQTNDHQECSDISHVEADFGLENAIVAPDESFGEEIVGEMSKDFANEDPHDRSKVQKSQLSIVVTISAKLGWGGKEDRR